MFRLRNIATLATLGLAAAALPHAAVAQQTLYVANNGNNTIEKINSSGSSQFTVSGGLNDPQGLAFDSSGNLYVANESDFRSSTIYKYNTTTGSGIQIANGGAVSSPIGLAFDSVGNLYAANNHSNSLTKLTSSGSASVFGINSGLSGPTGLAFDSSGNLYVANSGSNTIEKYNTTTGIGTQFNVSGVLSSPAGLAFDSGGNLYVANSGNNTIEEFNSLGVGSVYASTGLNSPKGLAFANDTNPSAAPEPSEWAALGFTAFGIGGLLLKARKRKANAAA